MTEPSPLLGSITATECGYTDCILSESDKKNIENLNRRLYESKHLMNEKKYFAKKLDFENGVDEILKVKKI